MKLSDFDYELPRELVAQYPPQDRDASLMMVLDREKGSITHAHFKDIAAYFKKGDTVVFNDSKVIPARILCRRETGGKAEIFLLRKIEKNLYEALARPASKLAPGKKLILEDKKTVAEIIENREPGKLIKFANIADIEKELKYIGSVPLPPYIKRRPEKIDEERYQTVYAKKNGATASPTAGLHFTADILRRLGENGVNLSYITLHVNYGTFAPVKTEDITRHRMHREYFELPKETADAAAGAKRGGGRVMAVGTTATRVLEANADVILKSQNSPAKGGKNYKSKVKSLNQASGEKECGKTIKGWTGLYIYPPYKFKVVDMLLTNFHFPKSTLLMLVSAFAGREFILQAYREAVKERYRFFSYGDCMLII